ncbi:NAD(P)-binding protein [Mycena vulgaris]|nr:NAD(P)-binding protein [Mycena vulgaris]
MLPALISGLLMRIMSLSAILFPPGPTFIPERDIPDLSGKVVLVTGGTSGIGYHSVKELLLKGATVYLAARSAEKGAQAVAELERETTKTAKFLELDLADLRSVRRAATEFLHQESKLDILFNNAGVMEPPTHMLTAQNIDLQFGTNVVGHFLLTELLIPALSASSKSQRHPARIINVSSSGHRNAPPGPGIEFGSLTGGEERDSWISKWSLAIAPTCLYGQSKLGNILVSNHFAEKYQDTLVSTALHPGGIRTELRRYGRGMMHAIKDRLLYPPSIGTLTQLWAATAASPADITGQYLVPSGQVAPAGGLDERASNFTLQQELITYLEKTVEGF